MDKEILYEILNSKSEILSSVEIESILNDELDKSPEEMDTDLIDLCLDALNTVDEEKLNKQKKTYRLGKILIAAAIFALVIGITIPVCAKLLNINVPDGIVAFYKDCFHVDLSPNEYVDDIAGQLEQDGIENAILPKIVFYKESVISHYLRTDDTNAIILNFDFTNDNIDGSVTIQKYNEYNFYSGKRNISLDFEDIEYIKQNDVEILVFSKDDLSYIYYTVDKAEYSIVLDSNFETAYQIAKSI
ncbi:MAG: hypothetical protein J1E81_09135 [Eubacterium sp.]|nr:hypothetical protein [Eubacterium sp.]